MTSPQRDCVAEPISFLRLERYRLHELSASEERAVSQHLAQCPVCRGCYAEVERELELPELPALPERRPPSVVRALRPRRWLALGAGAGAALALAAAALLVVRGPATRSGEDVPPQRFGIKGGDVAIDLVRKHQGALSDAAVFVAGDVFKVLVTCPPPLTPRFDVVVYQGGEAHFPLAAGALESCGNRRPLAGAFALDGAEPAVVCVALDEKPLPSRSALGEGPSSLPELSVCTRVSPR